MHKVADVLEQEVDLPLLHIGDTTAAAIAPPAYGGWGCSAPASRWRSRSTPTGCAAPASTWWCPSEDDQAIVHRIIYDELCLGVIRDESREEYRRVIRSLVDDGAEGVIYGCTEIELLVGPEDSPVPTFPTTRLHVEAAVERALASDAVRRPDLP